MKNKIKTVLALVLALSMVLCFGAIATAEEQEDKVVGYLVSYTLEKGDTVSSLCKRAGVNFEENKTLISALNNISNYNTISAGKKLWLPTDSVGQNQQYYILVSHLIKKGDTLEGLFRGYEMKYSSVERFVTALNPGKTYLITGNRVTLPILSSNTTVSDEKVTDTAPVITSSAINTSKDTNAGFLVPYTVKAGDTLSKICKTNNINYAKNIDAIKALNNIWNINAISVGQKIWLPAASASGDEYYEIKKHTVSTGETMSLICAEYGMKYSEIKDLVSVVNNVLFANTDSSCVYVLVSKSASPVKRIEYQIKHKYVDEDKKEEVSTRVDTVYVVEGQRVTKNDLLDFIVTKYKNKDYKYLKFTSLNQGGKMSITIEYKQLSDIDYITYTLSHNYKYTATGVVETVKGNTLKLVKGTEVKYDDISNFLALENNSVIFDYSDFKINGSTIQINYTQHKTDVVSKANAIYLVPCVLNRGNTVNGLCEHLGIDFRQYKNLISAINKINNYYAISAGTTLWLPAQDKTGFDSYFTMYSYEVKEGDTLDSICESYNTKFPIVGGLIEAINGSCTLIIGEKVCIPVPTSVTAYPKAVYLTSSNVSSSAVAINKSSVIVETEKEETIDGTTVAKEEKQDKTNEVIDGYILEYTVSPGDTVFTVCTQMNIEYDKELIMALNNISDLSKVNVGQTLKLKSKTYPKENAVYKIVVCSVKTGDTLSNICSSYGISYSDLIFKALNGNITPARLSVGQRVYIPIKL